jgi:hypothetical protein
MTAVAPYFPPAAPRFQSSHGEMALFDGEKLVDPMNQPITPYPYTLTNFFQGDYLNLYYNIGGATATWAWSSNYSTSPLSSSLN